MRLAVQPLLAPRVHAPTKVLRTLHLPVSQEHPVALSRDIPCPALKKALAMLVQAVPVATCLQQLTPYTRLPISTTPGMAIWFIATPFSGILYLLALGTGLVSGHTATPTGMTTM